MLHSQVIYLFIIAQLLIDVNLLPGNDTLIRVEIAIKNFNMSLLKRNLKE